MVRRVGRTEARIRWIVAKLIVFDQVPYDIDAEPIDPASKPKTHHLIDGRSDRWIAPVQIRLSGEKGVIVILSTCAVIFPGAAVESRQPIIGWPIRNGIPPDVPVALATSSRGSALQEPGVTIGGVVGDQIENDLDALRVGGGEERVEVVQVPKQRINVGIGRNVVTEVCHGRPQERPQLDRVDTELDQIRQALRDSLQVTNAVAVTVLKRPRIDLIDDAGLPPKCTLHETHQVRSAMMM